MKTLYLDCEFDGFMGSLISMALVGEDCEWYEVKFHPEIQDEWVRKNVIPILGKSPVSNAVFIRSLESFLSEFEAVEIVVDWPDDIKHFCQSLITGPGTAIKTPFISFVLDRSITYESKIPHNALEDARAIMISQQRRKTL